MTATLLVAAAFLPTAIVVDLLLAASIPERRPIAPRVIRINPRVADLARRFPPSSARAA